MNLNHNIYTQIIQTPVLFKNLPMGLDSKQNVCCMWVVILVPFQTIINEEQSLITKQNSNPNLTIAKHAKTWIFQFKNKERDGESNLLVSKKQ
jgi:hypothetical protein